MRVMSLYVLVLPILRFLFFVYFSFICLFSLSIVARSETLKDALESAYLSSPILNGARATNRATAAGLESAYSGYRPRISFSSSYVMSDSQGRLNNAAMNNPLVDTSDDSRSHVFRLSQNLFNGFRTSHEVASVRSSISADAESLRAAEQDVFLSVVQAYTSVLRTRELLKLRNQNIAFLEEQTRSARARLGVGNATRTDVAQAESQLELARAQRAASLASFISAQSNYRLVVGTDPDFLEWPSPLNANGSSSLLPATLDAAISRTLASHPMLQSAHHNLSARRSEHSAIKSAIFPSLDLVASSTRSETERGTFLSSEDQRITFNLSVPLYQGGQVGSALRRQRALVSRQQSNIDQARLQLRSFVVSVWSSLDAANANYNASVKQLDAAKLALDGVMREHEVGDRTQLDILDAQSFVLRAEESVLSSRASRVNASYELLSAVGGLNAANLSLGVPVINPAVPRRRLLGIDLGALSGVSRSKDIDK